MGIIAGVVVNSLRILDLAAEKDIHTSIRGDVQLMTGILDRHDQIQKMQQVSIETLYRVTQLLFRNALVFGENVQSYVCVVFM